MGEGDADRGTAKLNEPCDSDAEGKGCVADHSCAKAGGDAVDKIKELMGDKAEAFLELERCVKDEDCGTEQAVPNIDLKIEVVCAAKALAATASALAVAALM